MSGRIFGGFLMRRAFELAFACAYTFAGWRPQFVRCEEVTPSQPPGLGLSRGFFRVRDAHERRVHK